MTEQNKDIENLNKEVTVTTNNSYTTSNVDKILFHQLDVVTKDPIKDKAWEHEQQKKTLQETTKQEQSPKVDTKTTVQEASKPKILDVSNVDLQTLKIWFDTKPFTNELENSIRVLPRIVFSDDTIEYYIQERMKKNKELNFYLSTDEEMSMALATDIE